MQRRHFLKSAGLGTAGVAAAPFVSTANAQETITWNMVTSWPKNFPGLGTGANDFAARIEALSGGRMRVRVHGAGELVPALEVFDAVSAGTAEMGHSASYYWRGKVAASQFFTAVPDVKLRSFPEDVMQALYEASQDVIREQTENDADSKKVYDSYHTFQELVRPVTDSGEFTYLKNRERVSR